MTKIILKREPIGIPDCSNCYYFSNNKYERRSKPKNLIAVNGKIWEYFDTKQNYIFKRINK